MKTKNRTLMGVIISIIMTLMTIALCVISIYKSDDNLLPLITFVSAATSYYIFSEKRK